MSAFPDHFGIPRIRWTARRGHTAQAEQRQQTRRNQVLLDLYTQHRRKQQATKATTSRPALTSAQRQRLAIYTGIAGMHIRDYTTPITLTR